MAGIRDCRCGTGRQRCDCRIGLFLVLPISYGVGELASVGWLTGWAGDATADRQPRVGGLQHVASIPNGRWASLASCRWAALTDYCSATRIAVRVGQGVAILFVIAGLHSSNPLSAADRCLCRAGSPGRTAASLWLSRASQFR